SCCRRLVKVSVRSRPMGAGGEQRVRVGVVDSAGTAGPAGSSACGAVATTKPPTNVSDGHSRVPPSGAPCSAQESPAEKAWGAVDIVASSQHATSNDNVCGGLMPCHVAASTPLLEIGQTDRSIVSRVYRVWLAASQVRHV